MVGIGLTWTPRPRPHISLAGRRRTWDDVGQGQRLAVERVGRVAEEMSPDGTAVDDLAADGQAHRIDHLQRRYGI